MRNRALISALLIGVFLVFVVSSFLYRYWESIPYTNYKTGEEISGFPFSNTSMTVTGFSTAPDITFPRSSTDIFVNITIRRTANINQSLFPEPLNKHLYLVYQTALGYGELSAWNDSLGIPENGLNSLAEDQSVDGSIKFVTSNGNYTFSQLVCRAEAQMKPLFIVNLQNSQ